MHDLHFALIDVHYPQSSNYARMLCVRQRTSAEPLSCQLCQPICPKIYLLLYLMTLLYLANLMARQYWHCYHLPEVSLWTILPRPLIEEHLLCHGQFSMFSIDEAEPSCHDQNLSDNFYKVHLLESQIRLLQLIICPKIYL